ncbi:hypothetical protein [Bradyrhizobium sp. BR 1433]
MTKQQIETVAKLEALVAKNGSTPLLQMLIAQAKAGELVAPKRMI